MVEKLKGRSKLGSAKRPKTIRDKPIKKEPKLGLLTEKSRRMVSFRMTNELIETLEELLKKYRTEIYHKISKTDILEAAVFHASRMPKEEFIEMCAKYGIEKNV